MHLLHCLSLPLPHLPNFSPLAHGGALAILAIPIFALMQMAIMAVLNAVAMAIIVSIGLACLAEGLFVTWLVMLVVRLRHWFLRPFLWTFLACAGTALALYANYQWLLALGLNAPKSEDMSSAMMGFAALWLPVVTGIPFALGLLLLAGIRSLGLLRRAWLHRAAFSAAGKASTWADSAMKHMLAYVCLYLGSLPMAAVLLTLGLIVVSFIVPAPHSETAPVESGVFGWMALGLFVLTLVGLTALATWLWRVARVGGRLRGENQYYPNR